MGLSIRGYVLEPPRAGQSNSPFTSGPNTFVPQTLLPGIFTVTTGNSAVPTSSDLTSILSVGDTVVFTIQVGVTYTVGAVTSSEIYLEEVFSGVLPNNSTTGPSAAYSPQVGTSIEAYNAAYPADELNPRNDYLVLVTSELAPGMGATYSISQVQNYQDSGIIQITSSAPVADGQYVVIYGVEGVPGANGEWIVSVLDSTDFILNSSTFSGLYTGGGTVLVIQGEPGLLTCAGFGWTKNEIVQRLDYDSRNGKFRPLPGGTIVVVGPLQAPPTGMAAQLTVPAPLQFLSDAPYRLSIGTIGSGITQAVELVLTDADFTSPPPGTTQLSLATGDLNWNLTDLNTYNGQTVRWQQQQYFPLGTSTGNIGTVSTSPTAPYILLNPIPGHGQYPLIRFGYLYWLQTTEVATESAFTPPPGPPAGTVEWALSTGRLNFNSTPSTGDLFIYNGTNVYYDGTLFARDLTLPRQSLGPMTSGLMGPISTPVPATGDIIFTIPSNAINDTPYYQFPYYEVVGLDTAPNTTGLVSIGQRTGNVLFSSSDASTYSGQTVTVVFGDLPIDHGISFRFYRCPVNLTGQTPNVKDVTAIYSVQNAVWASPIPASPLIFLPSTPVNDDTLQVFVGQGTGTFTGILNPVGGPSPIPGLGYTIDFDTNQLSFAIRIVDELNTILVPSGFVQLQNPIVLASNIALSLETGTATNVFLPLTVGVDCLVDSLAGLVYFISTFGVEIDNGSVGSFTGMVFIDPTANFVTANVQAGDYLLILTDTKGKANGGVYTITSVASSTTLTTDVAAPSGSGVLFYEILSGIEIMADRFFQPITLTDPTTSVERITDLGTIQNEIPIAAASTATFPDLSTLSDSGANFTSDGVQPGDTINLPAGPSPPTSAWFLVLTSTETTLTPTTSFTSVASSTYSVTRRLQIPVQYIGSVRFRFGDPTPTNPSGVFSTAVHAVVNDGAFTSPAALPQGTVEVSQATGNLNFSSVDVSAGGMVYVSRRLALGIDYQVQPQLGFLQFASRLLTNEEVLLTYVQAPPTTTPPTAPTTFTNERGTFLVRKELTLPHPTPTTTLFFNPTGKSVALNPPPTVFRGGRPQVTNTQVTVSPGNPPTAPSSMTFLPDNILTDALPHGSIIGPTENVYIDYYVYQAMGGEQTLTVLNPPLLVATVNIVEGSTSFAIAANQTPNFPTGFLMVVNTTEIYMIGAVTYDATADQTTINLGLTFTVANVTNHSGLVGITTTSPHGLTTGQMVTIVGVLGVPGATVTTNTVTVTSTSSFTLTNSIFTGVYGGGGTVTVGSQTFQSDQTNPPLQVASGPTPLLTAFLAPAYFTEELTPYATVARGMNTIVIPENKTGIYQTNVVLYITDGIESFTDFYLVTTSLYNPATNQTTVTLATPALRQYAFGQQIIYWSVRPIYAQAPTTAQTNRTPITTPQPEPITVIRRVAGQVGSILSNPTQFTISASGGITFATPLHPNEEFAIFYTGYRSVGAGPRLQATYTATIVPDLATNGLLGQVLNANYTIFNPDNFYYRVETMTNFKGQVAQEIQAAAQSQSTTIGSGPMTSNTTSPLLYQQGIPSVWFPPGDYANHDLIAVAALLYFNDAVNDLEDVLHCIDGRIVGDVDGRFLFDGVQGRYDYFSYDYNVPPQFPWLPVQPVAPLVPNQIDDFIQVFPGPLPTYPDYLPYFQQAYVTGPTSRFFTTVRNIFTQNPLVVSPAPITGPPPPNSGDITGTFNFNNFTSLPQNAFKRAPRAQTLFDYSFGQNTFLVDNTPGDGTLRPSWTVASPPSSILGMLVVLQDTLGNFYVDENDAATVVGVSAPTATTPGAITISAIPHAPAGPTGSPASPPVSGPSSYSGGASVLSVAGTTATISVGYNGIHPRAVGSQSLMLSGASSSGNNGTFPIVGVNPALGEILITNASAVAGDANNGSITWAGAYLNFVPMGATLTVSPIDICIAQQEAQDANGGGNGTYGMSYEIGKDVQIDMPTGNVLYNSPYWPFNGNSFFKLPTIFIPPSDYVVPVNNGDILECDGVGVAVTYTAPYQFPALYGMQLDDDGNQTIPIVGPTFDGEMTEAGGGALYAEVSIETPGSPFQTQTVTLPFRSTGDLGTGTHGPLTRITLDPSGAFPVSPQSLLGFFEVTRSSPTVVTTTDQTLAVFVGSTLRFASQTNQTYVATSVTYDHVTSLGQITLSVPYTGTTFAPTTADVPLTGTFHPTLGTNRVSTSTSQVGVLVAGDSIQFSSQPLVTYRVLSVSATAVTMTTPYTGNTDKTATAVIALTGTYGVTHLSAIVTTSTSQVGLVEGGDKIEFTAQPYTLYTILSVTSTQITLTTPYTGATTSPTTAQLLAATPAIGNLVRIVSGPNVTASGGMNWRPITNVVNVAPAYVEVSAADAWPVADTGFKFGVAISAANVPGLGGTATLAGTTLTDNTSTTNGPFLGGPVTMLGNTYGVMTFVGNSYNTTTLDTIIPVPPATASSTTYWGLLDQSSPSTYGSPVSIGDIVSGPGVVMSPPTTVTQIGPGQSIQLSQPTTGGAQTAAIFTLQFTQPPPTATTLTFTGNTYDSTIAGGPSASPPTAAASITGFSTPTVTLSNMVSTPTITDAVVGNLITITGANNSANNGTFVITGFVDSTPNPGVQYSNVNAVYPDTPPAEAISWSIPPSPTIDTIAGGSSDNNMAGVSIGDAVVSAGVLPSSTFVTQITQTGPSAFALTLNNAALSASTGVTFTVTTRAPVTPWSTTVDSLTANFYPPTQANTDGLTQAMAIGPIVVSGVGITYNPDVDPPQLTTIDFLGSPTGHDPTTSFTMSSQTAPFGAATASTETGLPLAYSNATQTPTIITLYIPYTVYPGWTVRMTGGPNAGERRQIVAVLATNQLQLDNPFTSPSSGGTYVIENPLNTYNGPVFQQLQAALATELETILTRTVPTPPPYIYNQQSEQNALLGFFETVFTTVVGPSTTGTISGLMLTDPNVHFIGPDPANPVVTVSMLVYVHLGSSGPQEADQGVYAIATVVSDHVLMVTPTFPASGTITYEIVSVFGISTLTLQNIFSIFAANASFVQQTEAFQTLISTTVPVQLNGVVQSDTYANGINGANDDLNNRYTDVENRLDFIGPTNATGVQTYIGAALSTTDDLYAMRYSWINARINLQSGYLILKNTAAAQVAVNQAATFNQLIQLLTIRNS